MGGVEIDYGATRRVTFDNPGTFYYFCDPHCPFGMHGQIVVEAASGTR